MRLVIPLIVLCLIAGYNGRYLKVKLHNSGYDSLHVSTSHDSKRGSEIVPWEDLQQCVDKLRQIESLISTSDGSTASHRVIMQEALAFSNVSVAEVFFATLLYASYTPKFLQMRFTAIKLMMCMVFDVPVHDVLCIRHRGDQHQLRCASPYSCLINVIDENNISLKLRKGEWLSGRQWDFEREWKRLMNKYGFRSQAAKREMRRILGL